MRLGRQGWIGAGLTLLASGPARAECLGSCANDLAAALLSMLVYALIGIAVLVMLIRAKWRRAGVRVLGAVLLLAIGLPLVSQGWQAWKLRGVEAREVVGDPPSLAQRTPLLIAPRPYCRDEVCGEVLRRRGKGPVYVVPGEALEGMDLSGAVALADLLLETWSEDPETGEIIRRALTPEERRAAAGKIDYLVVTSWLYGQDGPGPVEAALRRNPGLSGMGTGEAVRLLLAPLPAGEGILSLATLRPDYLDLSLQDRALAFPLAPRNTQAADNGPAGVEAAMRSLCPAEIGEPDSYCRWLLDR